MHQLERREKSFPNSINLQAIMKIENLPKYNTSKI